MKNNKTYTKVPLISIKFPDKPLTINILYKKLNNKVWMIRYKVDRILAKTSKRNSSPKQPLDRLDKNIRISLQKMLMR